MLTVWNDGEDGVVTKLFVEDTQGMLSDASVVELPGVDYKVLNGGNLPGGNNIGFVETVAFGPKPSPIVNGIGVGEEAQFRFAWNSQDEDLRIAVHVQSIGDQDASASFVSNVDLTQDNIPEPTSSLLLSIAGLSFAFHRRR